MLLQRNLSKRATCGSVMTDLTERWLRYAVKVDCNGLALCSLDQWEAVCFREVLPLYSCQTGFTLRCVLMLYVCLVRYVSLYILCVVLLLCTLSLLQYVCLNNIHVAVCPLIVMNPSLHEFPVVSPMSSVMAV